MERFPTPTAAKLARPQELCAPHCDSTLLSGYAAAPELTDEQTAELSEKLGAETALEIQRFTRREHARGDVVATCVGCDVVFYDAGKYYGYAALEK